MKSTQLDFTAVEAHLFPPTNTLNVHLRFLGLLCHIMSSVWCAVILQILKKCISLNNPCSCKLTKRCSEKQKQKQTKRSK